LKRGRPQGVTPEYLSCVSKLRKTRKREIEKGKGTELKGGSKTTKKTAGLWLGHQRGARFQQKNVRKERRDQKKSSGKR